MFCKNCGKEIADDSKFCQFCGLEQKQITKKETKEQKNFNTRTEPVENQNSGIGKVIIIMLAIAAITVGIIAGIVAYTYSKHNKVSVEVPYTLPISTSDYKIEKYENNVTSINVKLTAINEIKDVEISIEIFDKNGNILDEKITTIPRLQKGESRILTYSATEMNATTIKNMSYYSCKITKGNAVQYKTVGN